MGVLNRWVSAVGGIICTFKTMYGYSALSAPLYVSSQTKKTDGATSTSRLFDFVPEINVNLKSAYDSETRDANPFATPLPFVTAFPFVTGFFPLTVFLYVWS